MIQSKILICEPDKPYLKNLKRLLKDFNIVTCQSAAQLEGHTSKESYELIIIAEMLDDGFGHKHCKNIKKSLLNRYTPILIFSEKESLFLSQKAFQAGASDFIIKSSYWEGIIQKIKFTLKSHHNFKELNQSQMRQMHIQSIAKMGFIELKDGKSKYSTGFFNTFPMLENFKSIGVLNMLEKSDKTNSINHALARLSQDDSFSEKIEVEVFIQENQYRFSLESHSEKGEILFILQDITQISNVKYELEFQNRFDPLTSLYNRKTLNEIMEKLCQKKEPFSHISVDINRFKKINNSIGHEESDKLLIECSKRLKSALPSNLSIARFGKDEFNIIVTGKSSRDKKYLSALSKIIHNEMLIPFYVNTESVIRTEVSIGISSFPKDGKNASDMINASNSARIEAKNNTNEFCVFYKKQEDSDYKRYLMIESALYEAFDTDGFELYYQPQICLKTEKIIGVEALLRWNHKVLGQVSPAEFIPIAEELKLIHKLGDWIVRNAIKQAGYWEEQGTPLRVGINISPRQFSQELLESIICETIKEANVSPALIDIEITESMAMADPAKVLETLNKIKSLGMSIAIDDFGTGYSSLSYLEKFPVDYIKIDRAFITNINKSKSKKAIVNATIAMAKNLDMNIIAEGAETLDEYLYLKDVGCQEIQGFFISKSITADEVIPFAKSFNINKIT